jgi:hypothetical protein
MPIIERSDRAAAKIAEPLLHPVRLHAASEILSKLCSVPALRDLYAFYFDKPHHQRLSSS